MSMVDSSPLNLTTSCWSQSPRKTLHIHLPGCSACFYACRGMTTFSVTALVRKWSSYIHSHASSPNLVLRLDLVLPSTMLTCPLFKRKPSNWLLRKMLRCMPWLTSSSPACLMTSKKSHIHYVPIEDRLMFHGEALIIPPSERKKVLGTMHQLHQGVTKT